jgi:hypothetical protein
MNDIVFISSNLRDRTCTSAYIAYSESVDPHVFLANFITKTLDTELAYLTHKEIFSFFEQELKDGTFYNNFFNQNIVDIPIGYDGCSTIQMFIGCVHRNFQDLEFDLSSPDLIPINAVKINDQIILPTYTYSPLSMEVKAELLDEIRIKFPEEDDLNRRNLARLNKFVSKCMEATIKKEKFEMFGITYDPCYIVDNLDLLKSIL